MKILLVILILLLPSAFAQEPSHGGAGGGGGGIIEPNAFCQLKGFDFAVAFWSDSNGGFEYDGGFPGTSVIGNTTNFEWNVGDTNASGVNIETQANEDYNLLGLNGVVNSSSPVRFVTFCGNSDPISIPEFGTLIIIVVFSGLIFAILRSKK